MRKDIKIGPVVPVARNGKVWYMEQDELRCDIEQVYTWTENGLPVTEIRKSYIQCDIDTCLDCNIWPHSSLPGHIRVVEQKWPFDDEEPHHYIDDTPVYRTYEYRWKGDKEDELYFQ